MRVDVADRRVGHRVDAVAGQLPLRAVAVVEDGVVGVGGELEDVGGEPVLIAAALLRRHRLDVGEVPLADVAGAVAGAGEDIRQRLGVLGQGDLVAEDAGLRRVAAGLERRAGRAADRLAGEGVADVGPARAAGRSSASAPSGCRGAPRGVVALLVGEEDDDVGLAVGHGISRDAGLRRRLDRPGDHREMTSTAALGDNPGEWRSQRSREDLRARAGCTGILRRRAPHPGAGGEAPQRRCRSGGP